MTRNVRFIWCQFMRYVYRFLPVIGLVLLLLVSEVVIRVSGLPSYIAPAPSIVFVRLLSEWNNLWAATTETALTAFFGFLVAAVVGAAVALAMAQFRALERMAFPWFVVLQSTPVIALAPLVIIWFGPGLAGKVFLAAIIAIFPVVVNSVVGLRSLPDDVEKLVSLYNASWLDRISKAALPNALPQVLSGLRVAATLSVVGAIVAELIFADSGLGRLLMIAAYRLDTPFAFGIVVCAALVGVGFVYMIRYIELHAIFWHPSQR